MHVAFQSPEILYLAMDYCPGGDLREFLAVVQVLSEDEAKLWFAEMITAVRSLHDLKYLHRDLKPDNFFIDGRGHIKLGDFGLSKETGYVKKTETQADIKRKEFHSLIGVTANQGKQREVLTKDNFEKRFQSTYKPPNNQTLNSTSPSRQPVARYKQPTANVVTRKMQQAYSVVGSPEYMSPEVIKLRAGFAPENGQRSSGSGYGREVDWWSLGCVFFECILGAPPFTGDSVEAIFSDITNWEQVIPQLLGQYKDDVSDACYTLLSGFLSEPLNRLGTDFNKLKSHPFFAGLDWANLEQVVSPFVPLSNTSDK